LAPSAKAEWARCMCIRRSGNRLRISVQLIDAADGYQMWSERYDREMCDIFALQDDITLAVVAALKVKLFGDARAAVLKRYTDNAEAYELFLKGRYHSYKYTAQGWKRAIEFFERAIAIAPDYALAYAGIAAARGCQWFFGLLPAEQTIPYCKAATTRALAIDDGLADAYMSLAIITFFYEWDWKRAEQTFNHSLTLKPNNAESLSYFAMFLAFDGRVDEAIRLNRKALALDPLAPLINMNVGWTFFTAGMLAEASQQAAKMIESDPDFYGAYWLKGAIHLSEGEFELAVEQLRTAVSLGGHQVVVADLASACSLAGRGDEAAAIQLRLLELRRQHYVPAICLARVCSRVGDTAKAIEWLETAFAERNGEMVLLRNEIAGAAEGDPLRRLADDPTVIGLLDRMHLP
jgi:adenylate cyclase